MSVATGLFAFDNTYARELEGLYERFSAAEVPAPKLLVLNEALAAELGADGAALADGDGLAVLAGNAVPAGAEPIAQAYSGHQFGNLSPRLGDGRALLLGEVLDTRGRRRDLHLKGSGRTPFARGGDGKAVIGPMLREHVIGEALHALGIPTTRALAVVATGERVMREAPLPGAVLTRVAASHLRVGTFQYAAMSGGPDLVRRLADYAIARHHPGAAEADNPYEALYESVCAAQAQLIAQWMLAGFVHGVMNTDNMTISGESIDFGPCAFMDAFDPATVFSSIDQGGRYAYGNQPPIAQWNLARLAEALLPLIDDDQEAAVETAMGVLGLFPDQYARAWGRGMRAKLGLSGDHLHDETLAEDLLGRMQEHGVDFTSLFRVLAAAVRGDDSEARILFAAEPEAFDAWAERWRIELAAHGGGAEAIAAGMDHVNPVYIPRNHLVEAALTAAMSGDLAPYERLVEAISQPFEERPGFEAYASPAPEDFGDYRTFCGT